MFDPVLADIRFGCGRSPRIAPPVSVEALLDGLHGPDEMAARFPIATFDDILVRLGEAVALNRTIQQDENPEVREAALEARRTAIRQGWADQHLWLVAHTARRINTATPLRERLESFWADHFTVLGKGGVLRVATSPYVDAAIRPHLAGRFEDMLIAVVTHPLMLHYLDQQNAAGPNSPMALKVGKGRGLNENLARELLELHTLGVDGPYTQTDVTQMAELLTGLTFTPDKGTLFLPLRAEPGAETVLGRSYGGDRTAVPEDIHAALRDLARHPATAHHIAHKLAVHFVSDRPDPGLVRAMADAWTATGGDLPAVYAALLRHPSAWDPAPGNVKQPFDFIASACRALDVPEEGLATGTLERLVKPMRLMGQFWQVPQGPDGLPEEDEAWITPSGLAGRLQWAFLAPQYLRPDLPDPRDFVETALGGRAPKEVRFAAAAAETRADGIGVVLSSPAFQRM